MFRAPPTFAGEEATTWRRDAYRVALIGPQSVPHQELVERAGYQVVSASDGDAATELFGRGEVVDALVLDFGSDGRPPEAVLLFARRTSAGAPVIAIVPAEKNEAYRRAFLAGARDVLPAPARGEDLLAAVDLVLEPRGLADVVEELRAQSFEDDEGTIPLAAAPGAGPGMHPALGARIAQLEAELEQKKGEIEEMAHRRKTGTATFRQQALDAITARDRAIESRERIKQKLTKLRRDLKEKEGQLRLTERACEELTTKLREAREARRQLETRLVEAEAQKRELEADLLGETRPNPVELDGERTVKAPEPVPEIDPEMALEARERDAEDLAEMEQVFARYQQSLERIDQLEAALEGRTEPGREKASLEVPEGLDPAEALDARRVDEGRLEELEEALTERSELQTRITELEAQLRQRDAELRATGASAGGEGAIALEVALGELDSVKEAYAEVLGTLDAIRLDRDSLRRRLDEAEREAADALTRLDELEPLAEEVERLRRELHAEQASHRATRERLAAGPPGPAESGGFEAHQTPAEVWARADQLQFDLDRARAELEVAGKVREGLEERLSRQDAEMHSLRVMVAALTRDRSDDGSAVGEPEDEQGRPLEPFVAEPQEP